MEDQVTVSGLELAAVGICEMKQSLEISVCLPTILSTSQIQINSRKSNHQSGASQAM